MTESNQPLPLTFEDALKELESIVRLLERGEAQLEQAITYYERGMVLKNFLETKLKEAELKVEKVIEGPSGDIRTEPLNFED
ncbi:MAG: exodeoxyribonuclease VII small subunit [Alphaproteobacteria bacterium]|jgi:exodeoxyribonuclease VII small subunit|nr:exodeoxyribonuclease VII small subunit [Alphaproteobacteria bacterium]